MHIYVHAGTDKTGSTAVQSHFKLYRDFLLEHGVFLPTTALKGIGHVRLFHDMEEDCWEQLHEELAGPEAASCRAAFLSWEGIWFFSPEQIERLRKYLKGYSVSFIFYIRRQADVIQSGYLQRLKRDKQALNLGDYGRDERLLCPADRDYNAVLDRFAKVFGEDSIDVHVYDPEQLRGGSIVYDMLDAIGLPAGIEVPLSPHRQNVSLDVFGAKILNIFDSVCEDKRARERLVNELLLHARQQGGSGARFLGEAARAAVEAHYAESNELTRSRFGLEGKHDSLFGPEHGDAGGDQSPGESALDTLARQVDAPLWNGDNREGPTLAPLLHMRPGWGPCRKNGVCAVAPTGRLRFRTPINAFGEPSKAPLRLEFKGTYLKAAAPSRAFVGDKSLGEIDLSAGSLDITPELMEQGRKVDLVLEFQPAGESQPERRDALFRLEQISYSRL